MIKINNHIEIVRSSNKSLSSMSEVSATAIYHSLSKHFKTVGITIVNNIIDLATLVDKMPDLVFLGVEFIPTNPELGIDDPDKIWISDYLEDNNIAYTGSNMIAHNLQRNKHLAKQRVLDFGLKTSAFYLAEKDKELDIDNIGLNYPMFVKPHNRGGGLGIDENSVVYDRASLIFKVDSIRNNLSSDSLIENYLSGREFSVAILKDLGSEDYMVMPLELIAPINEKGSRLLSGKVKSMDAEKVIKIVDPFIKNEVSNLALNVFHALGARDYGRVDIRMDEFNQAHFLESNLIPSLIDNYGSFPKACLMNINLDYDQMIIQIANLGLSRYDDTLFSETEIFIADNNAPLKIPNPNVLLSGQI